MKKPLFCRLCAALCCLLVSVCLPLPVTAQTAAPAWSITLSDTQGYRNDTFTATVVFTGGKDLSSVLLRAEYDPQVLSCTKITFCDTVEKYSRTLLEDGSAKGIFTCRAGQSIPQNVAFAVFRFTFIGTAETDTAVSFFAEQLADRNGQLLIHALTQSFSVRLRTQDPTAALLSSLSCADGVLEPAFSPYIFDYTMQVPFFVTKVDFTALPLHDGATVLQMKHNLGAGGSESLIRLKVTGADAVTRQQYTVTVLRLPKPTATPKPTASPKPTRAPVPTQTPSPTPTPAPVSSAVSSSQSPSSAKEEISSAPVSSASPVSSACAEPGIISSPAAFFTVRLAQTETGFPVDRFLSSGQGFLRYLLFLGGAAVLLLFLLIPIILLQKKHRRK